MSFWDRLPHAAEVFGVCVLGGLVAVVAAMPAAGGSWDTPHLVLAAGGAIAMIVGLLGATSILLRRRDDTAGRGPRTRVDVRQRGRDHVNVVGDNNIVNVTQFLIVVGNVRENGPTEVEIPSGKLLIRTVADDVLEIKDEATAVVTRAFANAAGLIVVEPPTAAPLVGQVVEAYARAAEGTGTAHDAHVRIDEAD
jgi:hypothetical protein